MYPKEKQGYQLQFTIECSGIYFPDNIDVPQIYVTVYKEKNLIAEDPLYSERLNEEQNWIIIGKTEVLKNTSDPKFRKIFKLDCIEDEKLNLKFEIIENNIQIELGHALTEAKELLNPCNRKIFDIKNVGQLIIVCDKIPTPNQRIQLQLRANIKQLMCFCTSMKTYLKIYRVTNGTSFLAHQAQPIQSNQPLFDLSIPVEDQMEISIIEFQGTILDIISLSLKQLKQGIVAFKGKCKRVNLIVESFKLQNYPSFSSLVDKGLRLKLMVGIDYSSKNNQLNNIQQQLLYISVFKKLIPFLMQFSSKQVLQAYGIGARKCNFIDWIDDKPYDLFPLSGVYNQVEIEADRIADQYQDTFNQLEFNSLLIIVHQQYNFQNRPQILVRIMIISLMFQLYQAATSNLMIQRTFNYQQIKLRAYHYLLLLLELGILKSFLNFRGQQKKNVIIFYKLIMLKWKKRLNLFYRFNKIIRICKEGSCKTTTSPDQLIS